MSATSGAGFKSSQGLLKVLAAKQRPFTPIKPATRRAEFDIAVPPKWSAEVSQALARAFSRDLAGARPESLLQAFVDPSYGRGGAKTASNAELDRIGRALLAVQLDDLVSRHNALPEVLDGTCPKVGFCSSMSRQRRSK